MRLHLARVLAFLVPLAALLPGARAQAIDDRENTAKTAWRAYAGQTFGDIQTTVAAGYRMVDIKTDDPFGTRFSASYVQNAGAYNQAWWYQIDVDGAEFIAPGDMPARIATAVVAGGQAAPRSPAALTRCILDSLAAAYARTIRQASQISGQPVEVIHVVGGGSQNTLLCRLTAEATGLPVIAGPVEATALGNVLVQARAIGATAGTLEDLRALVAASTELRSYAPPGSPQVVELGQAVTD